MLVRVKVSGPQDKVVPGFTQLGNDARARGFRVFVEDPVSLSKGEGSIEVEVSGVEDEADGKAAVTALIDQIPEGAEIFTIVPRD